VGRRQENTMWKALNRSRTANSPEAADRLVAETEAAQRAERSEFLATRASALESLAVYLMRR